MLKVAVILCLAAGTITKAEWLTPFFKVGDRDDVTIFQEGDPTGISMNEEIKAPITVAIVAGYREIRKPNISSFDVGNNFDLGLDFVLNAANEWEMVVTKKQDYEQPNMQTYIFYVLIDAESVLVQITINNIFDNVPVITSDSNPCSIPELTAANYESKCVYNVFDADGMNGNEITFEIQGNSNEKQIFEFGRLVRKDNFNSLFTLIVKETLHYEEKALYNFRTLMFDVNRNQGAFNTIIEVEDIPNLPPRWSKAFASARFEEKISKSFDVIAIDGDTGINTEICYKVMFEDGKDYSRYISIGEKTGIIDVKAIDRDLEKNEFYPFEIFGCKCNLETSCVSGAAVIIIDDKNDNLPVIYFPTGKDTIELKEQTFGTLFDSSDLYVEDIDLGPNASYEIVLSQNSVAASEYSKAFNIVPNTGYQKQSFTISVANTTLLDFEDLEWQNFEITIRAFESFNVANQTTKMFKVQLLNWNDELPIFEKDEYSFDVLETVKADYAIGEVKATDKDINDAIDYFIVGQMKESIAVNILNGKLSTLIDDAFDYERQTEVFFQIQANDKLQTMGEPTHSTFTQIRIQVIDVNDEPPQLTMPRDRLSIAENVRNKEITREIVAFDPDADSDLKFTIDWENSYATKPGFGEVERQYYEGCFIITELPDINNKQRVFGVLSVNPDFKFNIDYERFEIVYLAITVEDVDQVIMPNSASGILVVSVLDENDNPPEFVDDTLTVSRKVIEEAEEDTLIGSIIARDIDGPGNNVIQYSIIPLGDTPDNWLKIDETTGVIKVLADKEIGCDVPKRISLDYQVRLFDGANETFGNIKIDITDINNKVPQVGVFVDTVSIYENATTGEFITTVLATDLDRDSPNNLIQYYINYRDYPDLQNYFIIDGESGALTVKLFGDKELDRDNGMAEHSIRVNFEDNYQGNGARNGNQTTVRLILKDCNDNAPQMPVKLDYEIDENADGNSLLDEQFYAPDKDEPNTPNSEVLYEILSIEPVEVDDENPADYQDLFSITSYDDKYGRLATTKPARGFSGKWKIEIKAFDRGDEWESRVSLSNVAQYFVNIKPFNFNAPKLSFPKNDASIRLDFESITIVRSLELIDGRRLEPFEAVDPDAAIFGDITFKIESDNDDHLSFEMLKLNRKQSELRVAKQMEERTYIINVVASDGGLRTDKVSNIRIAFVNKTGEPSFTSNTFTTDFTENEEGLIETRIIPEAVDPKNLGVINEDDLYQIYYFIDVSYRPEDANLFDLDKATRNLKLKEQLDRESEDRHEIRIISTNLESYPNRRTSEESLLTVVINVNDVNDNSPKFRNEKYAVGVSESDNLGKNLISLIADDPDLDDQVTYYLLTETIVATGENLEDVKETAFVVNRETGSLTLNFRVQKNMKGFFEFKVEARDLVDHRDEASVKIYLVAEANRVTFIFLNNVEAVRNVDLERVAAIFSNAYEAQCIIDDIQGTVVEGVVQEKLTDLRVHFVRNEEALEAKEILQKSSDIIFITNLNAELMKLSLYLRGLPDPEITSPEKSTSKLIEISLAIVSASLGTLLVALIVVYLIKTRSYNRQIKALTENSFASDTNDLKPNLKALPNTNIFAHEANVMSFNKTPKSDEDTASIISSDSDDFSGLPDSNIFNITNRGNDKTGVNNSTYI